MSLIFLIALPVLMYFLLIRPQQRRVKEQRALLSAVAEGDEVMTTAGIYGYVNAIEDDTIWLDIAEGVEIRIAKGAVARRIPAAEVRRPRRRRAPTTCPPLTDPSANGTGTEPSSDTAVDEQPKAGPEAEH